MSRTAVNDMAAVGAAPRALAKAVMRRGIAVALAQLHDGVLENLRAIGAEEDLGPIAARRTIEDCLGRARTAGYGAAYEL